MNGQNPADSESLGRYVRRVREAAGFSVRGLGQAARVNASWISHLEHGEYATPDPRNLAKLAHALDIEAADFYALAGYSDDAKLPGFAPYLRTKYGLPEEAVDQLAGYFDFVNQRYRQRGGTDERDN